MSSFDPGTVVSVRGSVVDSRHCQLVSLADALEGCERVLHDEFKDHPERALYMIGPINEANHHETN